MCECALSLLLDLQFALAHQTASAETEAELRSLVVGLQGDNEMNKDLVLSLQSELERSQQKVKELEEQLRWQQLENHNQITIKEAKIMELKKLLNPHHDFCDTDLNKPPMRQVSLNDLTRTESYKQVNPTTERLCSKTHATLPNFQRRGSQPMTLKPTLVPLPSDNTNLELKMQLQRRAAGSKTCHHQPWSCSNKKVSFKESSSPLPNDFKATVASLPPILKKPPAALHNVQSLAVDLDFVKLNPTTKKALAES